MAQLVSRANSVWEGSLDTTLLRLSLSDQFTVRDAVAGGVLALAQSGAGKTSGPGKATRQSLLTTGFGGIVLVVKPDELETWLSDARACGRERSVIVFDERHGFNFLEYSIARFGPEGVPAAVEDLMLVQEMCRNAMPGGGRAGDFFWQDASRKTLNNILPVLYAAYGRLRLEDILDFLVSAPTDPRQLQDDDWRQSSFMWRTMRAARMEPVRPIDPDEFVRIASYFKDEYALQDAKLRTNVTATVSTSLDRFMHGRLAKCFAQHTSIVPELIFGGAVIILKMPSLIWGADGVIGQQVFKYFTQRAILHRNALAAIHRERPVFIYADECQVFHNSYDAEFLSMSRSSRCASIYMTQSLPTIYAKIGGENPKYSGDMFVAQFGTKVFGNLNCPETSKFCADTIGRSLQLRGNSSRSENSGWSSGVNMGEGSNAGSSSGFGFSVDHQGNVSRSANFGTSSGYNESIGRNRGYNAGESNTSGYSEVLDYDLEPSSLSRLRTGGPANGGIVDTVWVNAAKRFNATGRPWLVASYRQ